MWFKLLAGVFAIVVACLAHGATSPARVTHTPAQPGSGQPVTITAQLGSAARNVVLRVQFVEPGAYLRSTDPAYTNEWREFPMARRLEGFTAVIPAAAQQHRRLVRYVISFASPNGTATRLPPATNECPNFAYFVYDGVPAWTGASQPGRTAALTFTAEFMATLPSYHLLAVREDVERSQWDGGANKQRFRGTLIYDGHVYDHIQFHNRGRASIYNTGKNKWGFKFNRDEPFQARDAWGRPYPARWSSVSLTACASPWAQVNRGMAGMDEAVSFRAYQLVGVPSPATHWISLRVISRRSEAPTNNQYAGDLWGLYLVVEEPGGAWLRDQGLPDGDIYYPETGLKHRAKGWPENETAYQRFLEGSERRAEATWWRTNLNLPNFYSFNALNRLLANVDLRPGANHYLYHPPDGRWNVVPWDLDMMFIPRTHQPGFVDQIRCLDVPVLQREYQNRAREILDLFCADTNVNGGQFAQLVDELARQLAPTHCAHSWPELDQCVWNHHPHSNTKGQFYLNPARDDRQGGAWKRTLATPDFAGFCKYLTDFATDSRPAKNYAINDGDQRGYGFGYLALEARDEAIPQRPVIRLTGAEPKVAGDRAKPTGPGPAGGSSATKLLFNTSPFAAAAGSTNRFAAIQWRLGEISAPGVGGYEPGKPCKYEIEEFWRSEEFTTQANQFSLAVEGLAAGHTYRARAHYKDTSGRWSHWSEPVPIVAR